MKTLAVLQTSLVNPEMVLLIQLIDNFLATFPLFPFLLLYLTLPSIYVHTS